MGASAISVQAAVGATVLLAIVAFFISPFSAIFVVVAGIAFVLFLLIWGRRGQEGASETKPSAGEPSAGDYAETRDRDRRERARTEAVMPAETPRSPQGGS